MCRNVVPCKPKNKTDLKTEKSTQKTAPKTDHCSVAVGVSKL